MTDFPEGNRPGYEVYSAGSLGIYDVLVLGISNRFIWKCPTGELLGHYRENLSSDHMDVGIGTGYFLDKVHAPWLRGLTLLDPNTACLGVGASRLKRFDPELVHADALVPLPETLGKFGSIGVNYVLHCLPGNLASKAIIFDHLIPHLDADGVIFGATILGDAARPSVFAGPLMGLYNRKGIFSNAGDSLDGLTHELERRFERVNIRMVGCVALFAVRTPL